MYFSKFASLALFFPRVFIELMILLKMGSSFWDFENFSFSTSLICTVAKVGVKLGILDTPSAFAFTLPGLYLIS